MFKYFDTEIVNNKEIVDVFKKIDLGITTDKYTYHDLSENENLMDISFKYYANINDWWCIYLFNNMYDVNFDIISDLTIESSIEYYIYNLNNYALLPDKEKQITNQLVRTYYASIDYDIIDSIKMANESLKNVDGEFIYEMTVFIKDTLINNSYFSKKLKIPKLSVVLDIKNKLEELSVLWKSNK